MAITDKEIIQLKTKYGAIFQLDIPTDEGDKTIILRKLDRATYSAGSKLMEKDELLAAETFLRGLYIGGDELEPIIKDFESLRVAASLLADVIGTRTGNVRKL
tara:strand:+ start:216 stop:524 length:309 start_codon:yes stop_codon:yes gene_type:complete